MAKPKLHLDADASSKALQAALLGRGHDVTRTPNEWVSEDASDQEQLQGATDQGRSLFTFNVAHFAAPALRCPNHAGVILVARQGWSLSRLIRALDRMLSETQAEDMVGQVRWLNDWRE